MTLKVEIECDGNRCLNVLTIEDVDSIDFEFENSSWHENPYDEDSHYCPTCWIKVKKEIS